MNENKISKMLPTTSNPQDLSRKNPCHFHCDEEEAKRMKLTSYSDMEIFVDSPNPVEILRDLCIKRNYPLPEFELVQQTGTYAAPEYTYLCTVSTIKRMATAETKKIAKQVAAQEVIKICESFNKIKLNDYKEDDLQVTSFENAVEDQEEENYRKFKSYRELTESDVKLTYVGKKFSDRYQYFRNFYDELKREAFTVMRSDDYLSQEDKVFELLRVLKLKHKKSTMNMLNMETHIVFEVVCDIDVVFINKKEDIYNEILQYFQGMLSS